MHTNDLFFVQLKNKEKDEETRKFWTEFFFKIRRCGTIEGNYIIVIIVYNIISLDIDAVNIRSNIEQLEDSTFKQYFLKYWLSDKWLPTWIDATRPEGCESKGLWRTNNYTEAQIKRICHTYLHKKHAISLSEYLKIVERDMMLDTITFVRQLNYGNVILQTLLMYLY